VFDRRVAEEQPELELDALERLAQALELVRAELTAERGRQTSRIAA